MLITEFLKLDHARIRRLLEMLETAPTKNRSSEKVRATSLVRELTALQRVHEAIEEDILLPALESREAAVEPRLLADFEAAHKEIWKRLKDLEVCVWQDYPMSTIARSLEAYSQRLREHMKGEEHALFPLADRILPKTESEKLAELAKRREIAVLGAGMAVSQ